MKIALLGYGKMGQEIELIATHRGHTANLKVNSNTECSIEDLRGCDVAIEFSRPETASENIRKCFDASIPVVVGTTGWYDDFDALTSECAVKEGALFYATNFSIGVNIFFQINKRLAALMNEQSSYDVRLEETHHIHKLDAPSGTAITLAEQIIDRLDRKLGWTLDKAEKPEDLLVKAFRENEVPGTHVITYKSEVDEIRIKHEAKSRKGFALGAVLAAEWMKDKKGVYTMDDLLNL